MKKAPSQGRKDKVKTGQIRVSTRGQGYFSLESGETLEILPEMLNTALDGDQVKILELPNFKGKVLEVKARAKTRFVGIASRQGGRWSVDPDSPKFYKKINLVAPLPTKLKEEDKVLVEMKEWNNSNEEPEGTILEILGPAGEHETEMRAIMAEKDIQAGFTPALEKEAKKIKEESEKNIAQEITHRRDYRKTLTITIDPVDAKDFDDALSFRQISPGLYEVGIHIADVTHYLKPETPLDKEAAKRATSIYLVDRTIPMLPEILSNDICSLLPNQDRLTFSVVVKMNEQAEILDKWIGKTVINSNKRFGYEEVQQVLDSKSGLYAQELAILNRLAQNLDKKKLEKGALVFETDETRFELDQEGRPISAYRKERLAAHKLIEDFMLLANRLVAEYISKLAKNQEGVFVYRVHDEPDPEKMEDFVDLLKLFGYKLKKKNDKLTANDLNKLLKSASGKPEEQLINRSAVRAMSKAVYSMKNIGHFGLAFHDYTHFTSPIRRYPDMMVHRLLEIYLSGKRPSKELLEKYDKLCLHSSEMEKRAAEAERDSIKYKQAEYLSFHLGEIYDGVISGITKWGVYVEELGTGAEGLVRMKDLGNDYFIFDEKKFAIIGEKTRKTFRLGDEIKVKVLAANPLTRAIDFELTK